MEALRVIPFNRIVTFDLEVARSVKDITEFKNLNLLKHFLHKILTDKKQDFNQLERNEAEIAMVVVQEILDSGKTSYDELDRDKNYLNQLYTVKFIFEEKAPLYSEFAMIVCATFGYVSKSTDLFTTVSFTGKEYDIILKVNDFASKVFSSSDVFIAGHHILGYDIPMIFKRSIINGLKPALIFDMSNKKPWEVNVIDTLKLWQNGSWYGASLDLLCEVLNIPSPKDGNVSGKDLSKYFWDAALQGSAALQIAIGEIAKYCERDNVAVGKVLKRYRGEELSIFID